LYPPPHTLGAALQQHTEGGDVAYKDGDVGTAVLLAALLLAALLLAALLLAALLLAALLSAGKVARRFWAMFDSSQLALESL